MSELFADVIGHVKVTELLASEFAKPGQAYLFVGPQSVGKAFVALRFATGLLGGDSDERSRRLALAGTHPDLTILEPEGATSLGVDQAREVVSRDVLDELPSGMDDLAVSRYESHAYHPVASRPIPKPSIPGRTRGNDASNRAIRSRLRQNGSVPMCLEGLVEVRKGRPSPYDDRQVVRTVIHNSNHALGPDDGVISRHRSCAGTGKPQRLLSAPGLFDQGHNVRNGHRRKPVHRRTPFASKQREPSGSTLDGFIIPASSKASRTLA